MRVSELDLSIIIPFKDKSEMTITCLETLIRHGDAVKEIILLSNNSTNSEYEAVRQAAKRYRNAKVLVHDVPFNYQEINNWAVRHSTGRVIMLLNNDIELEPASQGLLAAMYANAIMPHVGAVGCVLLYGDGRAIQHAGVYLIPGQNADHLYAREPLTSVIKKIQSGTYQFDIRSDLPVNAVTAAAVMIERKKYDRINGLNEDFIIGGGDVDLCLRLSDAGYNTILTGSDKGYMIHKESKTRSMIAMPYSDFVESYKSYIRHFDIEKGDPYLPWQEVNHVN